MPDVLKLSNGSVLTIFKPADFERLVDAHLGGDAAQYFRSLVETLEAAADKTETAINTDLSNCEASLESNALAFSDILEQIGALETLVEGRMGEKKARLVLRRITSIVSNQM